MHIPDGYEQKIILKQGQKIPTTTLIRSGPKQRRNEPCYCESGIKYKKCCGVGK